MLAPFRLQGRLPHHWVIVGVLFVIMAVLMGTVSSFGVFFKSIQSEFDLTRAATSAIFSVSALFAPISGILGGWASDRFGPRVVLSVMGLLAGLGLLLASQAGAVWQLFATYSLLAMGTGAIYVVMVATVSRWFDKNRGLAVGIAGAGGGLGILAVAPVATFLISEFDWQMAYLVLGLIVWLTVIPLSRLLRKSPYEIAALPDGAGPESMDGQPPALNIEGRKLQPSGLSVRGALKTRGFWLFMFIWLFSAFCMMLLGTHIVPHATDMGGSALEAAAILGLMSGATAAGMVLLGITADRLGRKKVAVVCALFGSAAMLWLVWAQDLWMFYVFAIVYGLVIGGFVSSFTPLLGDFFGLKRIGSILGVLEIGWAIGAVTGPVVGGIVFDVSNSYSSAFLAGAAALAVMALLIASIPRQTERSS